MNKNLILGIIVLAVLVAAVVYANVSKATGNVIQEDVFEGRITNMQLEPAVLDGEGVYDRSCNMVGNGLTQCDAGIQTEKGLLNFNYRHNMNIQPCISEGDKLKVEILDTDGSARVTR